MKKLFLIAVFFTFLANGLSAQEHRRYALIWNDEFNSGELDGRVWSKIRRGKADWVVHMSSADTLYSFEDGNLVLRGMVNDFMPNDNAPFLTGGVWSRYKKSFGFGRIEIRAKFDVAEGYWPAIWMLPQVNRDLNWPHGGEIDIMEHFREKPSVDQTVHSNYTVNLRKRSLPAHVAYPAYNEGEFNTYGMERFHDSLVFFVNGRRTFNYPRFRMGVDGQFPFSQHDYYLILDAQVGRDGSPSVDTAKLPVELRIDYVRYYELDSKTDVIPEPKEFQVLKPKKKKLRRVVYDKKTQFDNPDEYHIVVKCGKATVSGNRRWAESTLSQLVDQNGRIANLEVHDWATCAYRGVSLEKCGKGLSFDDLHQLLERMAFYKLNCLKWNGENACTEDETNMLLEYASKMGIAVFDGDAEVSNVAIVELNTNAKYPAMNRVFLDTAVPEGAWLVLNGLGEEDMDALMAFSERYWRGGNAGDSNGGDYQPDILSTAGSRLANFLEKVTIHRKQYSNK